MTILFLTPSTDDPAGGVKTMYHHVDVLLATGMDAAVLHTQSGFRCTWFENRTPIVYAADSAVTSTDLVVVPELMLAAVARLGPGVAKVIFNQGPYLTFQKIEDGILSGRPPLGVTQAYLDDPDMLGVLVVSEDSREYVKFAFPGVPVGRVRLAIDPAVHTFRRWDGRRRIAYMPRRQSSDLAQVLGMLGTRKVLDGWELAPIAPTTEHGVAESLRDSSCFLSVARQEGFGLPPAEAMAAGSLVIGFPGRGGREFFDPDYCFPVPDNDVVAFASTVEDVVRSWDDRSYRYADMTKRASAHVLSTYSFEHERDDLVAFFGAVSDRMSTQQRRRSVVPLATLVTKPRRFRRALRQVAEPAARRYFGHDQT